jgi:hypothetical protein
MANNAPSFSRLLNLPRDIRLRTLGYLLTFDNTCFTELPRGFQRWDEEDFHAWARLRREDPGFLLGEIRDLVFHVHHRCRLDTDVLAANRFLYNEGSDKLYTDNKFVAVRGLSRDVFKDDAALELNYPCWAMPANNFVSLPKLRPVVTIRYLSATHSARTDLVAPVGNTEVLLFPLTELERVSRALENLAWNTLSRQDATVAAPPTPRIAYILRPGAFQTRVHAELMSRLSAFVTDVHVLEDTRHRPPVGGSAPLYSNPGHGGVSVVAALERRMLAAGDELQALEQVITDGWFDPVEMVFRLYRFYVENEPCEHFCFFIREETCHDTPAENQIHHRLDGVERRQGELMGKARYLLATLPINERRIRPSSYMHSSLDWSYFLDARYPYRESCINPDKGAEVPVVSPLLQPPPTYFPDDVIVREKVGDYVCDTLCRYRTAWAIVTVYQGDNRLEGFTQHERERLRETIELELWQYW